MDLSATDVQIVPDFIEAVKALGLRRWRSIAADYLRVHALVLHPKPTTPVAQGASRLASSQPQSDGLF